MIMAIIVFGVVLLVAKILSDALPKGFWFASLAGLGAAIVALPTGMVAGWIIFQMGINVQAPVGAFMMAGLKYGAQAMFFGPLSVWLFRRSARKREAANQHALPSSNMQ